MGEANQEKSDRRWTVLRLPPAQRELVRQLGAAKSEKAAGFDNRDKVFRELVRFVEKVELPEPPRPPRRRALRVSMPRDLDAALASKTENTPHTKLDVLLEAIRLFRQEYLPDEPEEDETESGEEKKPSGSDV